MATNFDTYDIPKRIDASGINLDNGFVYLKAGQTPTRYLGVAQGGESAAVNPLSAVASVVVTTGVTTASVAFTNQTPADQYLVQYWNTNNPNVKLNVVGTGTPIVIGPLVTVNSYKARVQAQFQYDDGTWLEGAWSTTASFTQS